MSEKMREEFELWASNLLLPMDKHDGNYVHSGVNRRWQAWQASRAALVVELPAVQRLGFISEPIMDADDVKYSLEDAGISYK